MLPVGFNHLRALEIDIGLGSRPGFILSHGSERLERTGVQGRIQAALLPGPWDLSADAHGRRWKYSRLPLRAGALSEPGWVSLEHFPEIRDMPAPF